MQVDRMNNKTKLNKKRKGKNFISKCKCKDKIKKKVKFETDYKQNIEGLKEV